jgi:hypothetical protein
MKAYEDNLYDQWRENVESTLSQLLKRNLLVKPHERQPPPAQVVMDQEDAENGQYPNLYSTNYTGCYGIL